MSDLQAKLIIVFFRILGLLPLWFLRLLGRLLGKGLWLINSEHRFITETNLCLCFPDQSMSDRQQLAQKSMLQLGEMSLEIARAMTADVEKLLSHVIAIEGQSLLEQATAKGRGVIVLMPHLGNWELMNFQLSSIAKTTILYQPPRSEILEQWVKGCRGRSGATLVPTNSQGVKSLLKALKRGEQVVILPDQEPELSSGTFAPFYQEQALTMTLVSNLQKRTGAVVVCAFAQRVGLNQFKIVFKQANELIYDSDLSISVQGLNKSIEACVDVCPEQYQWEYKRFRKRPDGKKRRYKLNE